MSTEITPATPPLRRLLWWGRFGNYGPNYPRNRTVMTCLRQLGWEVIEFRPKLSAVADLEARWQDFGTIDAVWVPCFRQRDVPAAARWAKRHRVPLIFDPLISAYDKQVFERKKFAEDSLRARRLLKHEKQVLALADEVITDTTTHRDYFIHTLGCSSAHVHVIPVSAEEDLFYPSRAPLNTPPEFLFFGTFIGLQGPTAIAKAIAHYQGTPIGISFLGNGPERAECERLCREQSNSRVTVRFEDWIPFHDLPDRIRRADACLGVFGDGDKARRVIPNKVYQALACGKPVITLAGEAYPRDLLASSLAACGMVFLNDPQPQAIARAMADTACQLSENTAQAAHRTYTQHFGNQVIRQQLSALLCLKDVAQ